MTRQLPLTVGALAAIAVMVVVTLGVYVGMVAPRVREIARLEAQWNATRTQTVDAAAGAPITDAERARWRDIEALVRGRFVVPEDQLRVLVEVGQVARATGMSVTDLRLEGDTPAGAAQAVVLPSAVPPDLAVNPAVIRLIARHRYHDLVDFLDRVGRGTTYVALQSLDVSRVGDHLESDIRLASLRWAK